MPRRKCFGGKKFHANQFRKNISVECSDSEQLNVSASKKKIDCCNPVFDDDENINEDCYSHDMNTNIVIDLGILCTILNTISLCKYCKSSDCFDVTEEKSSRKGLSVSVLFTCKVCGNSSSSMSSQISKVGYDVNIRLVYAMRCIGKGKSAASTFCAMMNLPPPPAKFERYNNHITDALTSVCTKSMLQSIENAVSCNEGIRDISVALDGSWQKRGHMSMNGVMTATSLDNGKVVDFECLSKYCFMCRNKDGSCCDKCQKNYDGSSGGMESEGVLRIFQRSQLTRKVKYASYLGDGDSKGFLKIQEAKVYGEEVSVQKLECVDHVQKSRVCWPYSKANGS